MIQIAFPSPDFRRKKEGGKDFIFDANRKTWVLLTPEEWVRQNIVAYLVKVLHYPSMLIAVEKEIMLHDIKKRFDVLVYNRDHEPWMLIECKSMDVSLSEDVLQQVLRYNISVPVEYIVITNGSATAGWQKTAEGLALLDELPQWKG